MKSEQKILYIFDLYLDRDVQHNISYSLLADNRQGAINYASAGEVNPTVTMEWNQFNNNCKKLYGNFTTCHAAIDMDIQNTQSVYFRVKYLLKGLIGNYEGVSIISSTGAAICRAAVYYCDILR
jgi:hypothetical protein